MCPIRHDRDIDSWRQSCLQARERRRYAIHRLDDVGPRLPKDCKLNATTTIHPTCNPRVLRCVDCCSNIADADGRSVSEPEDDIVVLGSFQKLVVVVDGEALRRTVETSFRYVNSRRDQYGPNLFQAKTDRSKLNWIYLDMNGRLLLADDDDLSDPRYLGDLLRENGVSVISVARIE